MSVSDLLNSVEQLPKICDLNSKKIENSNQNLTDVPAWLTKYYLENVLKNYFNDRELKITDINIRPALGRGENYGGVLTRMKANFSTGSGVNQIGHYIVKTTFESDEFARKTMEPYDIFNREMSVYERILPKLKALLLEIGDDEQIFAETMAVDCERSALIFEDLNVHDFIMPNRLEGLNMDLAKIVLRKLAKMHATSAVLNEREHGALECYDRGVFNRYTENYAPCFVGLFEACSERVAEWPGYEQYAKKLKALLPIYMELGKRVFDISQGHIHVLTHGDLWTNNILVKYDKNTNKALDVIIIDLQYAAWGSPAIDLFYFLNSSLYADMQFERQKELIHHYYHIFVDTLRRLQYKAHIPSLHKFHLQLEEKEFYALHTSSVILPIQRNTDTTDADFNALMQTNERGRNFKKNCFKNPYVHSILKRLLPEYELKGLLDIDQ